MMGLANNAAIRNSQILALARVPIIKGTVVGYSVENGTVNFKVLAFRDQSTVWSVKKTY
jgi:uncharacterized membrane protein